jgi:hypothetical protein
MIFFNFKWVESLILIVLVMLVILGPIMIIWSLNTLFPVLDIPYTFATWTATIILVAIIGGFRGDPSKIKKD